MFQAQAAFSNDAAHVAASRLVPGARWQPRTATCPRGVAWGPAGERRGERGTRGGDGLDDSAAVALAAHPGWQAIADPVAHPGWHPASRSGPNSARAVPSSAQPWRLAAVCSLWFGCTPAAFAIPQWFFLAVRFSFCRCRPRGRTLVSGPLPCQAHAHHERREISSGLVPYADRVARTRKWSSSSTTGAPQPGAPAEAPEDRKAHDENCLPCAPAASGLRAAAPPAPEIPGRVGAHRAGFATGSAECGCHTADEKGRGPNARLVLSMDLSSWRC